MIGLEWLPIAVVFVVIVGVVLVASYLDRRHEQNVRERREGNS